ncbi:MAG: hypothetical protein IT355_07740 [Gemmatimonadaceae bacterium]|nr:hypothetical protein [Gemmatimonadaceae bacterium]
MHHPVPPAAVAPRRLALATLLLTLAAAALPLTAQDIIRSDQPWRTIRTRWFDVHYPLDTERWALDLAPQLDAVRDSVRAVVGHAPAGRTTIVIDDPYNQANGKAIPLLGAPVIHLWVTPPGPSDQIANHRGWGLKLVVHEFAHIAHLSRPVRGRSQWYWHALPAQVSPIAVRTPRWAIEGYATWVEGRVTGSGRPHGAWRPALLRELALAGRLPGYGAMSAGGGYKGGSMAYLAGSAFWEWLAAQRGDSSMSLVFRRQTARTKRSFDEAFGGVYGESPAAMYARFSAELTMKAFAVDTALRRAGLVTGTRLARFTGAVGGPAATRDGRRIALSLPGTGGRAPRIIVTRPDTQLVTPREREAERARLARDTADVAAIRTVPRLAVPTATLTPRRGRVFGNPRFIDSTGTLLLLESWSVRRDGSQRPDLAIWNAARGTVRFVTDGAAVQDADPSPDGTRAAAVRCTGGSCDLVLVTLGTGAVTTLAAGSPVRVFSHPRWSPDGRSVVTGVQEADGLWRLAMLDTGSGVLRIVTPDDDVNRHSASFDASGTELIYVSEAGGIPNVESLRLSDGARTQRTRVAGSVYEPTPLGAGAVLFLVEYAGGMELQRIDSGTVVRGETPEVAAQQLVPAMPRPREPGMRLPADSIAAPARYGAGPRRLRLVGQFAWAREGLTSSVTIASADPANRLTWLLTGLAGSEAAWRGGVASGAWYGSRPALRAEAFWLEQRATRQAGAGRLAATDARMAGASLAAELPIAGSSAAHRLYTSAFLGAAQAAGGEVQTRALVTAQYGMGGVLRRRVSAGGSLRGTAGQLGADQFTRGTAAAYLAVRGTRVDARLHRASARTPLSESFTVGGFAPPVSDEASLSQRVGAPSLPVGVLRARSVNELRVSHPMPFLPVGSLYAHAVGSDWQLRRHSVALGLEQGVALDHLGIVGLPRMRVLAGIARVLRGPVRNSNSAYLAFGWRP